MHVRPFVLSLAMAGVIAAGCSSPLAPDSGGSVSFTRLRAEPFSFEYNSGYDEPARLVVRDAAAWADVWATIHERRLPKPPVPDIDFSSEMVVVTAMGSRPTGGFMILVESAAVGDGVLTIGVHERSPGPTCGVTLAVTSPVDIARLPRVPGNVRFETRETQSSCG